MKKSHKLKSVPPTPAQPEGEEPRFVVLHVHLMAPLIGEYPTEVQTSSINKMIAHEIAKLQAKIVEATNAERIACPGCAVNVRWAAQDKLGFAAFHATLEDPDCRDSHEHLAKKPAPKHEEN